MTDSDRWLQIVTDSQNVCILGIDRERLLQIVTGTDRFLQIVTDSNKLLQIVTEINNYNLNLNKLIKSGLIHI